MCRLGSVELTASDTDVNKHCTYRGTTVHRTGIIKALGRRRRKIERPPTGHIFDWHLSVVRPTTSVEVVVERRLSRLLLIRHSGHCPVSSLDRS